MAFIKSKKDLYITPLILIVMSIVIAIENDDPRGAVVWIIIAFAASLLFVYGLLCHLQYRKDEKNAGRQEDTDNTGTE